MLPPINSKRGLFEHQLVHPGHGDQSTKEEAKMTNIIKFPQKQKRPAPLPSQRVFYIGFRYIGPTLCQEVQNLYLKRKGVKNGGRKWAMVTYAKYDESDKRFYSIELEDCDENGVPDMLANFGVDGDVTFKELQQMGWNGRVSYSAPVKSMFHKCYDGMKFPYFAKPLAPGQFGTKIMAQSRGAVRFLKDKPLHCFTSYGDHGWVWMNLETFDGTEVKAKPVKLQSGLPNSLIEKLHVKRKWPKEL